MIDAGNLRRLAVRLARATGWGWTEIGGMTPDALLDWLDAAADELAAEMAASPPGGGT